MFFELLGLVLTDIRETQTLQAAIHAISAQPDAPTPKRRRPGLILRAGLSLHA
jgi:hypothetical protein